MIDKKIILIVTVVAVAVIFLDIKAVQNDGEESENALELEDLAGQAIEYGTGIFDTEDEMTAEKNIKAFLQAIRVGEGTASNDGYTKKVGGGNFDEYTDHPAVLGWKGWPMPLKMAQAAGYPNGAVSTAAGAYQINRPTWVRLRSKLGLQDFSPESQDAAALELIREKAALGDVRMGRITNAVKKVRKVWASLPDAGYGQRQVTHANFENDFIKAGGVIV